MPCSPPPVVVRISPPLRYYPFRVCDNIAGVHLHEVWFDVKSCLTRARTADYQNIFIDIVLWVFVAAHHDTLRLRQQDILRKLWVDEGLYVLRRAP